MVTALLAQFRPLLHPMLVHFPIALLFASVALDWAGYLLKHPNLTRAGFYTLVLGALGAGLAALSGPDHAVGDPSVPALLAAHQTFASLTVTLAVSMVAVRFLSVGGIRGGWALLYLAASLVLLAFVSVTGYYGGEMTYHHAVGVTGALAPSQGISSAASAVRPLLPAKPLVSALGLLCIVGLGVWVTVGPRLVPTYAAIWWRALRLERANARTSLWTLQRGQALPATRPVQAPPQMDRRGARRDGRMPVDPRSPPRFDPRYAPRPAPFVPNGQPGDPDRRRRAPR